MLSDKAVQFATAKTVFSKSVLCMGGINLNPVKAWKEKIDWFMNSRQCRELDRIDEELVELEWNIFPGFTTTLGILVEMPKDNVIFMSLKNDIEWENNETEKMVLRILLMLRTMLENSRQDVGRFSGLDQKEVVRNSRTQNPMENGTKLLIL